MVGSRTCYEIVLKNDERIVLRDLGPWDVYSTITNAAEKVIEELFEGELVNENMRVFYYDSEGDFSEICHLKKEFTGFAAVKENLR